jgi:short subunit fatty acids transporter
MSFWSIMNWIAWGLCIVFGSLIAVDFIKVEIERKNEEKNYVK